MKREFSIFVLILFASSVLIFAQNDTLSTSEKYSTSEVVLTRDDFLRLACENVGDALRHISGVYVRKNQIAMRDVAPDKVVILLDGQRLNTAQGGGVDIITLPIDNVERIEVVRGGSSALYGADAVGGVIRITTRKKMGADQNKLGLSAHGTLGSFKEQIGSIAVTHSYGPLYYMISYKRTTSRGDFEYSDLYKVRQKWINNDQSIHDIFAKANFNINDSASMSVSGSYYYGDIGAPGLIHQSTPRARLNYDNKSFRVSYDQTGVFENFNMKVQFYALLFQLKYKNPDGIVPVNSKHNNDAYAIEIQQSGKLAEGLDVAYGYTFRRDDLNSTDIKTKYRNNNAAYIMGTYSLPNLDFFFKELSLTPAVRYDYPSDFSAEVSPKLSLALKHSGAIRIDLKTHITRSYRAPTFNDLYWPKDSYAEGNPNLKPEMGFNYDIGIGFGTTQNNIGEVSLNVNYFVNKLDNLILWSPGSDGLWRPNNISKTLAQGMETVFRLKPFGEILEIGTDYTFIVALDKSENATTRDKDLIYRPRNKIDITATIRYAGIEIAGVNHYVGKRYINAANTVWLESYNVVDASLSYSFKVFEVNWSAKLEGTNLTDLDYTITEGSPVPGRAYRFTLGFSF